MIGGEKTKGHESVSKEAIMMVGATNSITTAWHSSEGAVYICSVLRDPA